MKKQFFDPVNYQLTQDDLARKDYKGFLDDLTDVPSSVALKPYTIDRAGIVEQSAYIKVRSLSNSDVFAPIFVDIRMQVELSGHRGIHMSRCEQALFSLLSENHESLDDFTEKLAKKILELQESDKAYVSAEGVYIHERLTKKSLKTSYDKMTLRASSIAAPDAVSSTIGISAFNMTGCPCTETFTKFAVVPGLKEKGFNLDEISSILEITNSGTHTQRGLATINVHKANSQVTYTKLYDILDRSCHLVYELLKRPDEHELVVRVLRNPQFTEDVVRDIVHHTIEVLGSDLTDSSKIFASSQLFDSIHIHDVYTEIERTMGELVAQRGA